MIPMGQRAAGGEVPESPRPRRAITLALLIVITIGLASRLGGRQWPEFIAKDLGDGVWAVMFYLLVIWARPGMAMWAAGAAALMLAGASELSKLYRPPWIEALRGNRVGELLLGRRFLWANFVAYGVGAIVAMGVDSMLWRPRSNSKLRARPDKP